MLAVNRIVAGAGVLVAVVLACSGPGPDEATPAAATAAATATARADGSAVLADGRHFGYIRDVAVDGARVELSFDLAEFLTGTDAERAAREDGRIGPDETVDNDYYVRNRNDRVRTLPVAPDAEIVVVRWDDCCETVAAELEPFVAAFAPGAEPSGRYRGPGSQYWLTVSSGIVTRIEEQYVP